MKCPACDDSELQHRKLNKNGCLVERCPDCLGFWLDRGEFEELFENPERARESVEAFREHCPDLETRSNRAGSLNPRCCPMCQTKMHTGDLGYTGVEVEVCGSCNGIWFDAQELKTAAAVIRKDEKKATAAAMRRVATKPARKPAMKQCRKCGCKFEKWEKYAYGHEGGAWERCPNCQTDRPRTAFQWAVAAIIVIVFLGTIMGWW